VPSSKSISPEFIIAAKPEIGLSNYVVYIPDNVADNVFEKKVIEIAKIIGIKVVSNDIEACHRLKANKAKGRKKLIARSLT